MHTVMQELRTFRVPVHTQDGTEISESLAERMVLHLLAAERKNGASVQAVDISGQTDSVREDVYATRHERASVGSVAASWDVHLITVAIDHGVKF